MDVTGHNTNLTFTGFDDSGTIGSDQTTAVLLHHDVLKCYVVIIYYVIM